MSLPKLASVCALAVCAVLPRVADAAPQKKPAKTHAETRERGRARAHAREKLAAHSPEPTTAELVRVAKAAKAATPENVEVAAVSTRTTKTGKTLPALPLVTTKADSTKPKFEVAVSKSETTTAKTETSDKGEKSTTVEKTERVEKTEKAAEATSGKARPKTRSFATVADFEKAEVYDDKHMDKGLVERLTKAVDHFSKKKSSPKILLVSGYRPESKGSHHATGRAIDFRIQGVGNESLLAFCKSLKDTGCGFYPNGEFVHMDVREKGTGHPTWIDAAMPGELPRYVTSWPEAPSESNAKSEPKTDETPKPSTKDVGGKTDKEPGSHDLEDSHATPTEMVRIEKSEKTEKIERTKKLPADKADKDSDDSVEVPATLKAPLEK
ncbi:MAG: DUF882 domain-containing protein [Polyangiaceae bacterium]